ncbi:MAG: electron transfer flavoprotein subunit alpha/FixB family protein [Ignavibacteriales bacterium]|nr:electron transfer flavoprotein subunit alpha/FixB family protein [Ignavibacteriales bacterium]
MLMKIVVFAEQRDGKFKKPALEAVTAARHLGAEVVALVIGSGVKEIAPVLGEYGASKVLVVEDARLARYSTTAYAKAIADVASKELPSAVFIPATSMGKDCAPRVAVKLNAGLAADCTALRLAASPMESSDVIATRPVYAGKALTDVRLTSSQKVFTLRPNVFTASSGKGTVASVEIFAVAFDDSDFACAVTEVTHASGKLDVAEADIIVTGGRGLKGPENFKMIEDLAAAVGGAVGASRAVVDAGWRPHEDQVGQTGKTVSPSLYVAVAVSGAIQHLAGMSSSKYIVAINKDKDAPIFSVADYGIVADAFEIVPALTREVKKLLGT